MKKLLILITILATLISVQSFFACQSDEGDDDDNNVANEDDDEENDDDDESDDDDSDDVDPACEGNHKPSLLGLTLYVNETAVEMPVTVQDTDTLMVQIEYVDEDCNLEGGRILIDADENEPNLYDLAEILFHTYNIKDIGCSSEVDGPYNLTLDPKDYILPLDLNRTLPLKLIMMDYCTSASRGTLDFTVEDSSADDDDDDNNDSE